MDPDILLMHNRKLFRPVSAGPLY